MVCLDNGKLLSAKKKLATEPRENMEESKWKLLSERSQSEKASNCTTANYVMLYKRQNHEDGRKISGCQELGGVWRSTEAREILCMIL